MGGEIDLFHLSRAGRGPINWRDTIRLDRWVLREKHPVADVPVWVYVATLLGPYIPFTAANLLYLRRPSHLTVHVRAAADALAGIVVGQVGIGLGWVPSFVHLPVDNGATALRERGV